ncbi:MAG: LPS assembly protein LptD [Gammaproteobacteria bacterium]|nr:LPS assembly protein LptD [Gammaproteobacteria bacterium]
MLARSFLAYFLILSVTVAYGNDAKWNCQEDKKTKTWNCVGSTDGAAQPDNNQSTFSRSGQSADQSESESKPAESQSKADYGFNKEDAIKQVPQKEQTLDAKPETRELPVYKAGPPLKQPAETLAVPDTKDLEKSAVVSEAPPPVLPASEKPAPTVNKMETASTGGNRRGWNCDNKGAEGKWNCQLVGADPKGQARVVETEEPGFTLLDPTFNSKEELVFNTLRDRFENNPWGNCTLQLGTQKYIMPDKKRRDFADIDINSNAAEIYDNEVGNYRGNVDIKRADQQASSNAANYDSVSEALDLHGNVYYSEDEIALYTESANLKLASDEARMRDTLFISPTTPIRGKASAVYRDNEYLNRYKDAAYTSCEPGNQDWMIHASDVKMNKKTGEGSAKNAWLEFKGVPVFYSPYLNFPIDSRRKTGLLMPDFGNTGSGGFRFGLPFYWNIAPNFDATFKPRYYTKRGFMMGGDFRYLTEMTRGGVSGEYMPHDDKLEKPRYIANFENHTRFTPNLSANADLNILSDNRYFKDLGNALSFPTFNYIRSYGNVAYADKGISFTAMADKYRLINPDIKGRLKPYRRLPQLNLNFDHTFDSFPASIGLEDEYVYFDHSESNVPDGQRINIKPYVSFPIKTASAYVTPKLSLQYTQYFLSNQGIANPNSVSRFVPIGSVDSGVFLEKNLDVAGNSYLHTVEPRLFYLYIPKVNQRDIPIFDTALYDFQYDSLFRENRYSGTDRIQDANQLGIGLSSRLIDPETGLEKLKFNIGQLLYFQDREVTGQIVQILNPRTNLFLDNVVQNSFFSPLVAEMNGQINKHVSFLTGLQWDPDINDIVRGNASLHLERNPGEIVNVGYSYRKNTTNRDALNQVLSDPALLPEDRKFYESLRTDPTFSPLVLRGQDIIRSDISFRWLLYDNWFGVGRWQYSMLYNQTQDAFLGLQKETCCWRFGLIGRRYVNNFPNSNRRVQAVFTQSHDSQFGIFLEIEFKGFTGLGNIDLNEFLTRSIFGYRKKDY